MNRIIKFFAIFLYYAFAYYLPSSAFPGGKLYNFIRIFLLKRFTKIGKGCRIMRKVYVGNGKNIQIGDYCKINDHVRLNNVIIGNHVLIARESVILGKMHAYDKTDVPIALQGNLDVKPTIISDNVWIGLRCIIFPALTIGNDAIIAAGAVLTKNVEPQSIYGGVPAKFIKNRQHGE